MNMSLIELIPLSLGVEIRGNVFDPVIPRNSSTPITVTKCFPTNRNNQTEMTISVRRCYVYTLLLTKSNIWMTFQMNDIPDTIPV